MGFGKLHSNVDWIQAYLFGTTSLSEVKSKSNSALRAFPEMANCRFQRPKATQTCCTKKVSAARQMKTTARSKQNLQMTLKCKDMWRTLPSKPGKKQMLKEMVKDPDRQFQYQDSKSQDIYLFFPLQVKIFFLHCGD